MRYNFSDVGNRIRKLRIKKKWNQETFIEKLNDKNLRISRNTISAVENGEGSKFTLDFLLACCELFNCDMGFLLGEHECKTMEVQSIHDYTGLKESTIYQLRRWHELWGNEIINTIAILVEDMLYHNVSENRGYQPILCLINNYLSYSNTGVQKLVYSDGYIEDRIHFDRVPISAIVLDSTIIENAILAEIQYALKSLKKNRIEDEDKQNGSH